MSAQEFCYVSYIKQNRFHFIRLYEVRYVFQWHLPILEVNNQLYILVLIMIINVHYHYASYTYLMTC